MSGTKIIFHDNFPNVWTAWDVKCQNAINQVVNDVMIEASGKTPMKSGYLRKTRAKHVSHNVGTIIWAAGYAAVQEKGKRRGARPFTNYTTPGTGPHFVENAVKMAKSKIKGYFR